MTVIVILLLDICLPDTGHVMHVFGKQSFQSAKLEYSVAQQAALGCQLRYLENLSILFIFFMMCALQTDVVFCQFT